MRSHISDQRYDKDKRSIVVMHNYHIGLSELIFDVYRVFLMGSDLSVAIVALNFIDDYRGFERL